MNQLKDGVMASREIKPGVYQVGSIDWDRRLFDELIPLPDGTSYNSYLIEGSEKTVLVDTVDPTRKHELVANLQELGIKKLDYVVSNHAEQDHSGALPEILEMYPEARVVTNPRCKGMLQDLLLIPEDRFMTIGEGDSLSLGDRTLEFLLAPWVHWPETMFTYLREDRILFTCDFLGSHLATSDLFVTDEARVYAAAKRYYAEIMMPFRKYVRKNLEKIESLDVEVIATSHGPIYDKPRLILEAYQDWVSDQVNGEVVLAYISMHGSTRRMVDYFVDALLRGGVGVRRFNLTGVDIGELAMALVDAATLVIATPTVLGGPHPSAVSASYLVNALRPKTRYASIITSYSWGGRTVEVLTSMLKSLKVEMLEPVVVKGYPRDFKALDRLAAEIQEKHASLSPPF